MPSTFLANYAAATSFLEGLEAEHVRTQRQLDSFRGAPAVAAFLKRWNLSVYFSLRFQVSECRLQTTGSFLVRWVCCPQGVHMSMSARWHLQPR